MVVVVLGQRLVNAEIHSQLRDRIDTGLATLQSTDATHLICSGGRTNEAVPRTEAEVMKTYAIEQGFSPDRILTEEYSLDTIGNAYFTRRLIEDRTDVPVTISLVTSAYHEERSAYIFEQVFGDEYRIDTSSTVDTPANNRHRSERRSLEQAQAFFEPIETGDLDAIRRRLRTVHDYYDVESTAVA